MSRTLTKRKILSYCLAAFAIAAACTAGRTSAADAPAPRRPNFIIFLVSDMGWHDLTYHGKSFYETPNIDRIAERGIRFTSAYAASPVSAPTRASIMTGKYPARLGMTDDATAPQPDDASKRPAGDRRLFPPASLDHLPLEEATIAKTLHGNGYTTYFAGKWHLGGKGFSPEDHGFDINIGGWQAASPASYFSPYANPKLPDGLPGEQIDDRMAAESIKFLEHAGTKPFLLVHSFYSFGIPLQAKKELIAKYEAKQKTCTPHGLFVTLDHDRLAALLKKDCVYAAMLETMDQSLGEIIDTLDRLELTENTIVILTSDRSGLRMPDPPPLKKAGRPVRGSPAPAVKSSLHQNFLRVPLMIDWPGVVKMGSHSEVPVIGVDLYPTMLEMAGLADLPTHHSDGVSLVEVLKQDDKLVKLPSRPLFWHYPHYGSQGGPASAMLQDKYKLVQDFETNGLELYYLHRDPQESANRAATESKRAAEMLETLKAWQTSVGAKLPTPNPNAKAPKPPPAEKAKRSDEEEFGT